MKSAPFIRISDLKFLLEIYRKLLDTVYLDVSGLLKIIHDKKRTPEEATKKMSLLVFFLKSISNDTFWVENNGEYQLKQSLIFEVSNAAMLRIRAINNTLEKSLSNAEFQLSRISNLIRCALFDIKEYRHYFSEPLIDEILYH